MNVLVTGANGFVGQSLCLGMAVRNFSVLKAVRHTEQRNSEAECGKCVSVGNIGPTTDWRHALKGVNTVVHLAARVHVLKEIVSDPLAEFRKVNVYGTEHLAKIAAEAGVHRLVYVSSIGVNGKKTNKQSDCFSESDPPAPYDPYTTSKWEAEQALFRVSKETSLEIVILRPPLVYGPRAPGNFDRLINLVHRGFLLPLASVKNKRGFIYVGNLVSAIVACVRHPVAAGKIFLVSDGEDCSSPELIRRIAQALNRPARLLPFPPALLRMAGKLTGRLATVDRLLGSLVIDSSKIRRELDWKPPYSMDQGLKETAEWFKKVKF